MYGHISQLAEAEKEGLKKAGLDADIYQVAETLPQEVLAKVRQLRRTYMRLRSRTNNDARCTQLPRKTTRS
jgi:multimeric flavodoxin WrbA